MSWRGRKGVSEGGCARAHVHERVQQWKDYEHVVILCSI